MHLFCLDPNRLFLQFQLLNILNDAIVELDSRSCLEVLIGLIFINIHDLLLYLWWLLLGQRNLGLFLELVSWNVNKVGDISCWLSIFYCFSCSKTEILFLLSNFVSAWFLFGWVVSSLFFWLISSRQGVISLIFNSSFVDISELYKQFFDLPERLNLDIWYLPC